jgi:putative membrane protein
VRKRNTQSWSEAFFTSPGPVSLKEAALLSLKGLCMGSADIIPGVSGGTIALITGIYEKLLQAIKSLDITACKHLLKLDVKSFLSEIHIRFLLSLFLGISVAIISLARIMNYLLHHYPVYTWSLFFGLIAASILVVGQKVLNWTIGACSMLVVGALTAYLIVNMIPVSTPETMAFIFTSGFIAICAMILPGLSGAFILLILGKYEFITGTLKNPFLLENMIVIIVFCAGCFTGLLSFSRLLNYLIKKYHDLSLAFLTGLMAGSMAKIWPWKEAIATKMIRGKVHVLSESNILPGSFDTEFYSALFLAIIGLSIVFILERLSRQQD